MSVCVFMHSNFWGSTELCPSVYIKWKNNIFRILSHLYTPLIAIIQSSWGASMAEWLKTTFLSLLWVRILTGTFDSFMWGSYPAGSTWVPVRAWNNVWKAAWDLPPPVKLEDRHMTYTLPVWRKTQSNKQIKQASCTTVKSLLLK
jgi:hypothetical protein